MSGNGKVTPGTGERNMRKVSSFSGRKMAEGYERNKTWCVGLLFVFHPAQFVHLACHTSTGDPGLVGPGGHPRQKTYIWRASTPLRASHPHESRRRYYYYSLASTPLTEPVSLAVAHSPYMCSTYRCTFTDPLHEEEYRQVHEARMSRGHASRLVT